MLREKTVEPERLRALDATESGMFIGRAFRDALIRCDAVKYPV
jgi:hypothetical protein